MIDPSASKVKITRVRRDRRVGGRDPMRPRIRPIETHRPIVDHGSPNGSTTAARRRDGVTIARNTAARNAPADLRSEEHTSELQSRLHLVCRLLLEKKKKQNYADACR